MASINIAGDTSGSISLTVPSVAGTNTVTIPANSGVVMVSGNMPAFSVYLSTSQSISSTVLTKVAYGTKVFDTASCFNTSTNRFTPNVAGYYQLNGYVNGSASSMSAIYPAIYKNGTIYQYGQALNTTSSTITGSTGVQINTVVYMNGSTDYVEIYGFIAGGSPTFNGGAGTITWFNGSLVRAA